MIKYRLTAGEQMAVNDFLVRKGLSVNVNVTFGDVTLPENYSEVRSRSEIQNFRSKLTSDIELGIPIIGANMECLSDADFIVSIEREGGLGIVPQMIQLDERLKMLERIGRAQCALIDNPLTIKPDRTLKEAKALMERYGIYSLIVVNDAREPIGILSTRDWRYEADDSKPVGSRMGGKRKLYVAQCGVDFDRAMKILRNHRIEKLPLVNKRGELAGLITAHGLFYKHHYPRATRDEKGRFLKVGSIGVGREFTKRHLYEVEAQVKKGICLLLIDTARAFSINTKEAVVAVRKNFPKLPLMAGNVCTPRGAKFLFECGVDVVKVGIGPGEVCRTRAVGVGIPQISAIAKCSAIAGLYNKTVVGDGGMKNPGDIAHALIAGASAVMTGLLLVGTEESKAEGFLNNDGVKTKMYEGSASFQAQLRRVGRGTLGRVRRPEGIAKPMPVIGTVHEVIEELLDGLRSVMSYYGVRSVQELREKAVFELQTNAGLIEGLKKIKNSSE